MNSLNIYKIETPHSVGYNQYDTAVIVAESEFEARRIHPMGHHYDSIKFDLQKIENWNASWCAIDDVIVTLIGVADKSLKSGTIICAVQESD